MKKIISLIMALCLTVCGFSVVSSADEVTNNVFHYADSDVVILGSGLSADEMQHIADYIAYGDTHDDGISTCALCSSHIIETTYALQTTHNVFSTSPKCYVRNFKVECCTRSSCDYIKKTLIDSWRTSSCHG